MVFCHARRKIVMAYYGASSEQVLKQITNSAKINPLQQNRTYSTTNHVIGGGRQRPVHYGIDSLIGRKYQAKLGRS
jgi:hypothetical protein